jgi:hypothetical protein
MMIKAISLVWIRMTARAPIRFAAKKQSFLEKYLKN